ncbi:MAG: hypothetical protein FGF48_09155 [Candidatus Brockarchaeota archaeon]|nr:hypothetical protein [Candidatus Brockarchaeota archaeon]
MPKRTLAIIILILILTSHFDAILHLRAHEEEIDALTALRRIEEELEKGRIPSGSITEANFIIPKGFPVELAKKLWLFLAQLVSTGCSENEVRRAIIDANDTLRLPTRISYELKNYTIILSYDGARIIRGNDGGVSVEIPYKVVDGLGRDVDVSSIKYESNGTNLFHVLRRYPKRRTYLVRAIDLDAYTFTFIDLRTGEIFNKTVRMNIGFFSNLSYFGSESFIVAVPGHFEETHEAIESQVSEFRVLLPAYDPLVVDTSISPTRVEVGDVISVSARIRNPQDVKNFKVLLGIKLSDEDAFEIWVPPPRIISGYSGQPIYLHLRPKRPGVYQVTIYFAVVEPKNLDVVFWNGGKTVTYTVTVLPDASRLRVEVEAEALAKFANITITLVNSGGQEARDVKLLVTGDIEKKELEVGRVWHTWKGNVITRLLFPIARLNVTAVYHDLNSKRHTTSLLTTISTTNFVTPEEWRTYLVEVPEHEETKRVFVPSYQGATYVKLYLMKNCLAPSTSFFDGLSFIPISPNGFTLTLENVSNVAEIFSRLPEVRYMLLDVKPDFLYERVLREDEVKKLFHINEDERLEPNKIPGGYEVKLLKEEVLNQSEIVTVDDDFYEKLKHNNWEEDDYKYEDIRVKRWDLDKATIKVSHGKTIELIYHPLACQGDLVKGVLVKNYAARDMAYELEILHGPISGASLGKGVFSIQAHGSIPLNVVQLESMDYPIFIRLKYQGKVVATLHVFAAGRVSEFWSGFWDGIKEKLPGIIVTATLMVILAIPTHGGSLLAYVKDLLASAVIPSLLVAGAASNIREILEAYSAYTKIGQVAEELGGFSQRAAYAGYLNAYSFFQGLRNRIKEKQGYVVGSMALDLLADVTIRDLLIVFGREDAREYEKGKALGRLVGAALSLVTYVGIYYKFLSNGPKLLSLRGQIKEILKGVYNWITPPLWDVGVVAGKLTAREIAASLAFSEESDDFKQRLNEIKDDEGSLSSLVEFTGRFLDDALDVSSRLGLSECAFLGLLWTYGKCGLSEEAWGKFIQAIESIGGKSKRCADGLLSSIYGMEGDEVKRIVLEVVLKLVELSPEELEGLGKLLTAGVGIKEIEIVLEETGGLKGLLDGTKEFDFGTKPHKVTLKRGEGGTLHIGEGNKVEPGTYVVRVYWEYGEKNGVMEFPVKKNVESYQISIPKEQADRVLDQIGSDRAEILITKAELFDYRSFFPREFIVGGKKIMLDLFNNEMKVDGITYKFSADQGVHIGKICVDAEFEGKNIGGKNLVLSLYQDGGVRIRYGETPIPVEWIRIDEGLNLMEIRYDGHTAEYSFNLKPLDAQKGRISYEIAVEGKGLIGLKERLFRLLGHDALRELENRIEDANEERRDVLFVRFDNGKIAYCRNKELEVYIPSGAGKITEIEIVPFKELSNLKKCAARVLEDPPSKELKGDLGEAIVKEKFTDDILTEISRRTGIPKDQLVVEHLGKRGEPDFEVKVKGTGERVTVIEVKYVGNPENIKEFGDQLNAARIEIENRFNNPEWTAPYGVVVVVAWPAKDIIEDEPYPPMVGSYKNPYIEYLSREGS